MEEAETTVELPRLPLTIPVTSDKGQYIVQDTIIRFSVLVAIDTSAGEELSEQTFLEHSVTMTFVVVKEVTFWINVLSLAGLLVVGSDTLVEENVLELWFVGPVRDVALAESCFRTLDLVKLVNELSEVASRRTFALNDVSERGSDLEVKLENRENEDNPLKMVVNKVG